MRTLDAALTTAQRAASRSPYLRVYFDDRAGTTVTYTTRDGTNRIQSIEQWEEGWAGIAIVRLRNHDQALSAADYRGYSVSIGWGIVLTGDPGVTWYSNAAVMKVINQRDISYQGELVTEFYCVSIWAEIATDYVWQGGKKITGVITGAFVVGELVTGSASSATGRLTAVGSDFILLTRVTGTFKGTAPWDNCVGGTSTATLVQDAAPTTNYGDLVYASGDTTTEARIEALTGLTVDVDEDDPDGSMADTPKLEVEIGTSNRAVIRRMLLRTKCGIRFENDGHLHALYLDTAAGVQYEFQSTHAFFEDLRDRAIIMPNTVYFADRLPDSRTAATYVGTANDATSVAAIGTFVAPIQVDPDIISDAEGNTRAAAWIAQMVAQAYQGKITAPMECGLEVFDMVQAVDVRLNVTSKGRIGRIERRYVPAQSIYEVVMTLGSLYSEPGAMGVGPESIGSDLTDLVDSLDRTPPNVAQPIFVWQMPKAIQGYTHNIVFSATDGDTVAWTGSTIIKFYDGTTQAVTAGNTGNMADTDTRYVYFDLDDDNPNVLKVAKVDDYVSTYLTEKTGVLCLVKKSSAAAIDALFVPSYGKEPLITADHIHMAGLLEVDLGAGAALQAILSTQISAGQLKLTVDTVKDGEWYSESGVDIDAAAGINIYGVGNALTTRATKTGTIQCYVGSDGKFYASAGDVILDDGGITITRSSAEKVTALQLKDNNAIITGWLLSAHDTGGAGPATVLTSINNSDMYLLAEGTGIIYIYGEAAQSVTMTKLTDPSGDFDAAHKKYVDDRVGGLANIVEDITPQLGGDLDLNTHNIDFPSVANVSDCKDEDNMASDSPTMLATQQSIKAYADTKMLNPLTTAGDVLYSSAGGTPQRLAANNGRYLKSGVSAPYWTLLGIVDDTTPQLGGDLDLNAHHFNAGADHAYIDTTGAGRGYYITVTNDGSAGAHLQMKHLSASPAANDYQGIYYISRNSTPANYYAGFIKNMIVVPTAGSEDAKFTWNLMNGGANNLAMELSGAGALWLDAGLTVGDDIDLNGNNINLPAATSVVTGSRAIDGTVYQNTSGFPMFVVIYLNMTADDAAYGWIGATSSPATQVAIWDGDVGVYAVKGILTFVVPPSWYYKATETGSTTLNLWVESTIGG